MELKELCDRFLDWYRINQSESRVDDYNNPLTENYLSSLSNDAFVKYFMDFAIAGGGIQSNGQRNAGAFKDAIEANFGEFRERILSVFKDSFNLYEWLEWADGFNYFGDGLSTIFLHRTNIKYHVVNRKSIDALRKLGYRIKQTNLKEKYRSVEAAEKDLLTQFPELKNNSIIDLLTHYIIGVEEGISLVKKLSIFDYFDIKTIKNNRNSFGKPYSGSAPATKCWIDTRVKLVKAVPLIERYLSKKFDIVYNERPNTASRVQNLKNYILIGISPKSVYKDYNLFIKIAFHNLDLTNPTLDIELDQDNKKKDNKPFEAWLKKNRNKYLKTISLTKEFPQDWPEWISRIGDHVGKLAMVIEQELIKNNNSKETDMKTNRMDVTVSRNTILYGPPGTGKTFNSITHAVAIADKHVSLKNLIEQSKTKEGRQEIRRRYEELHFAGRIEFVTFHQSLGYEDFIEGIKPMVPEEENEPVRYEVNDGVFKRMAIKSAYRYALVQRTEETNRVIAFSDAYDLYLDEIIDKLGLEAPYSITTRSGGSVIIDSISARDNIMVKHTPDGRLYTVSKQRLARLAQEFPDLERVQNIRTEFRSTIGGSNATAYWAVLHDLRQVVGKKKQKPVATNVLTDYDDQKSVVLSLPESSYAIDNVENYVLIIDEINRGNVSQIFGELISLIEDDKRLGNSEALTAALPYSGERFGVPRNLYIIGTMNTADRSVEALDTALRRRFSFVPLMPDPSVLKKPTEEGIDLQAMLTTLNKRLRVLKDEDHTIGHAWLMGVHDLKGLQQVFGNKILPLLQEYFYNDYEKLGLVLGNDFFIENEEIPGNIFAAFTGSTEVADQYAYRRQYKLKSASDLSKADFESLYPRN